MKKSNLYIIGIFMLVIIVAVMFMGGNGSKYKELKKSYDRLSEQRTQLINQNQEMNSELQNLYDEFEVAKVQECRFLTKEVMKAKEALNQLKEVKDGCVGELKNSYNDLIDPYSHYEVKGNVNEGWVVTDKAPIEKVEVAKEKETQQIQAAQPTK